VREWRLPQARHCERSEAIQNFPAMPSELRGATLAYCRSFDDDVLLLICPTRQAISWYPNGSSAAASRLCMGLFFDF
jgi:hypothetical protein